MIRRWCMKIWILFAVLGTALPSSAFAIEKSKEKDLGGFGVWRAYQRDEGGQTVCYMVTAKMPPASGVSSNAKGSKKKVRTPYVMITHRPVEASSDVFSYGAGAMLDTKHSVTLRIGKEGFDLFAVRDTAWARDALTDHKIAKAVRGSAVAQVSGILSENQAASFNDKFSLNGALEAYRAIGKACGLADVGEKKKSTVKPVARKRGVVEKSSEAKKKTGVQGKKAFGKKEGQKKEILKKTKAKETPSLSKKNVKKTKTVKKTVVKKPPTSKEIPTTTDKPE